MTKKDNSKCNVGSLEAMDSLLHKIKKDDDFRIIIIEKSKSGVVTY
jgi:hypothetical protein